MGWGSVGAGVGEGAASGAMAGPWGAAIGAGIGLFGSLFGAHMQSKSAQQAALLQAAGQREALDFYKSQATNAYANNEVARRGNYDQWLAREQRLGSIGAALGYGRRNSPAYVPGVEPMFSTVGSALIRPTDPRMLPPQPSVGASLRY